MRRSFFVLLTVLLAACSPDQPDTSSQEALRVPELTGATPWTDLAVEDAPDDFHFVVVTDRTCCARPGVFAGAMPKVNLLAPAFVVSVGDLIEGYTENQDQLNREWDEMESFIGRLDAPFFYTPGNHDMNNAVMAEEWQRRFGPSYYHFLYKGVLFLVLNSELFGMVGQPDTPVPGPWTQQEQMHFLRTVLAEHPDPRWTIVLLHQPLWTMPEIDEDWLDVESLLGERRYTVFAGHYHQYSRVERHNRNYITLATTGGGSDLRGTAYGEFDHVAWVTMREDGPRIANVLLDGIQDEDVSNPEVIGVLTAIAGSVTIQSSVADDELFSSATSRVAISNPTDSPITASPRVARRTNFDVSGLVPVTIPAGESVEMFIRLSTEEPLPYRALAAAALQWTVTATADDRVVQFPVTKPVLPLTRHRIGAAGEISIDGDLAEWGELTYVVERQGDVLAPEIAPEDASYRFDVREGPQHLFVAVDVTDDDVQSRADLIPRAQDAVRLFIDPRAPARRDASMGAGAAVLGGDMAAQIGTIVAAGESLDDELLGFVADTNAAIDYKVVPTEQGYAAEFAVPLSLIRAKAAADDASVADPPELRISVGIYDLDEGDHGATPLYWQPYRYGSGALPGAALFVRP